MNTDDFKIIWGKFRTQVEKNKKLKRLYKLAEEGRATYEDARALSSVFSDIIVDSAVDVYPGQIDAIMQALQDGTLGKQYFKELSGYVTQVQRSYNESLGIGLKPVEVNTNRQLVSNDFVAGEDYQKAVSAMRRRSELSSNQFVDYAQKANAEFQSNDFKITVSRIYDGIGLSDNRSCKWCLERCGRNVPYEKAVAMGMFQRHEGCHCVIEYNNNGTKTYQSGKGGRDSFTTRKPTRSFSPRYKQEYERIHIPETGKSGPTHVNSKLVNTQAYHQKFEGLTGHKRVDETMYNETMRILYDNNDTEYEHIVALDARTGTILAKNTGYADSGKAHQCGFSRKQNEKLVRKGGAQFEVIHNHPNSSFPSRDDIRVLFQRENQKGSTIACHNGDVYRLEKLKGFENIESFVEKVYSTTKLEYEVYGSDRVELETATKLVNLLTRRGVLKYEKR